jgi:insulysin
LGHLLGHEGKGSILSYLKSLNLAEELCSSFNDDFSFCGFFTVEVKLTDKGFQMVEEVVEAVFAYLDMLKTNGPKSYVFEELQRVAWAQFLFRNKKDPYGFCSKLSSRMAKYPVSKILTAPELYTSFDAEIVAEITNLLTFDNLQLFLVSKTWNKELMIQEPYFGTYFSYEEIPENLKNKILKPKSLPFHLPDINSYIPDTFETLELGTSKYPEVLLKNERLEVYFKQDSKFEIDKVYGQLVIFCTSTDFSHNPCMFMCAKMWEKLLNEKLREETYLADLAGLKHDFEVDNHGVRVSLNGFSQKYPNFLRFLLEKISNFKPSSEDQSLFDDLKNELMTSIANCYFSKPTVQVQRVIYELNLQGGYFTQLEKLRALNEIDLKDVIWFSLKWLNHCYFQWFLMGNIRKEAALELAVSCTDQFLSGRSGCFDKNDFLRLKITKIPKNSPEIFILPLTDTSNSNSVMVSLYQIGPESIEDECLVSLVENYLEEPFFDELRTKEQLGYIVNSYSHKMRGVFHFIFMIQSSTHSPEIVFAKIQEFLRCSLESVQNISDKKFKKLKKSTLETSFKKDLSLYEEFQRYRHEIDSAALVFNRKQLVKEKFKEVTKENFIQFYFKIFRDCFRRIDICLASNAMHETLRIERNVKVFKGLKEFRLSHSSWPQVHKMK